jgi:tetratricopeptide (TPR) repeat protein
MKALRLAAASLLALQLLACGGGNQGVKAQALPPADAGALSKMARAVEGAPNERSQAIDLLRQAVADDPTLWEARFNLGVLLAERGELSQAETQLAKAAELAPNAEDVAVALGEVRRRRGEPKEAVSGLQQFVKAFPLADGARAVLVGALREAGEYDAALDQARQILVRRANDPNALAELALTYLARGELDTAELLSAEALKGAKPTATAERTAGLLALESGDDAKAFRHFERASEIDPKDHTSQINIGNVLLKAGVYGKAEQHFRAVLALNPDDKAANLGLAAALRGRGGRDKKDAYLEAERVLKQLLEHRPSDLEATFNLGVLYGRFLGRQAEASQLMKTFLSEAPGEHPSRPIAEDILKASAAPAAPN